MVVALAHQVRKSGSVTNFDAPASMAEITLATAHLLEDAAFLDDDGMRAPSTLPGWSRGHVLTHIARNADGLRNILTTASSGVVTPMYASNEARNADVEAGAGRPAAEILADLEKSSELFTAAYEAVGAEQWETPAYRTPDSDPLPARVLFGKRLGEVVVHHVDLDVDYTPAHWPETFTDTALAECPTRFGGREDFPPLRLHVEESDEWLGIRADGDDAAVVAFHGPQRALLAWIMGRASGDGLTVELAGGGRGPLPELPSWG